MRKSLSLFGLLFVCFACINAVDIKECRQKLLQISQGLYEKQVYDPKVVCFLKKCSDSCEEDLIPYCDALLLYPKELGEKIVQVSYIKDDLIKYLRSFVASGMDLFEVDPNFALFLDNQNPDFIVTFKNPEGETKTRKYALSIWSIGFKLEFAIRVEAIMIVGSDFNYYDSLGKGYDLGSGIDISWSPLLERSSVRLRISGEERDYPIESRPLGLCFTTARINGTQSRIIIGGVIVALRLPIEISYVFGGKMTPVSE
jgi:hypothetical protein